MTRTLTSNFETPSDLHAQALYGTSEAQKQNAQKQLMANSGHGPDFWEQVRRAQFRAKYRSNAISANAGQLEYEEWRDRDDMVVPETQEVLTAVDDLVAAGFVTDTSLARLVSTWENKTEFDDVAERSMDGRARSTEDDVIYSVEGVPLPITHVDWEVSQREQANSENFGEDIDTANAEAAAQQVREDLEDLVFNGWGDTINTSEGSFSISGYTNDSDRISGTASGDWGTPSNVLDTIDSGLADLEQQGSNNNDGYMPEQEGVWMYVPTEQWGELNRQADPRGDGNMSIRQRVEQDYPYIDIRHAGQLTGGNIVMVIQNRNVVDLADAQALSTMSWDVEGGFATQFKTLACRVPRIKNTFSGRSGILHYTGA